MGKNIIEKRAQKSSQKDTEAYKRIQKMIQKDTKDTKIEKGEKSWKNLFSISTV